jgi:hypothetical protein
MAVASSRRADPSTLCKLASLSDRLMRIELHEGAEQSLVTFTIG